MPAEQHRTLSTAPGRAPLDAQQLSQCHSSGDFFLTQGLVYSKQNQTPCKSEHTHIPNNVCISAWPTSMFVPFHPNVSRHFSSLCCSYCSSQHCPYITHLTRMFKSFSKIPTHQPYSQSHSRPKKGKNRPLQTNNALEPFTPPPLPPHCRLTSPPPR